MDKQMSKIESDPKKYVNNNRIDHKLILAIKKVIV